MLCSGASDLASVFRELNFLSRLSKRAKHKIRYWNSLESAATKVQPEMILIKSAQPNSATSSMLVHFFFCLVHVPETCLPINTKSRPKEPKSKPENMTFYTN